MSNIKVKIVDSRNLIFELEEDAKKGDRFNLSEDENINYSNLRDKINKKVSNEEKKIVEKYILDNKFKILDEVKKEDKEYQELLKTKKEYSEIQNSFVIKEAELINSHKILIAKKANDNELEIEKLENKIDQGNKNKDLEIQNKTQEQKEIFQAKLNEVEKNNFIEINKLKNEIIKINESKESSDKIKYQESELKLKEVENKNISIITQLKNEIKRIKQSSETSLKIGVQEVSIKLNNEIATLKNSNSLLEENFATKIELVEFKAKENQFNSEKVLKDRISALEDRKNSLNIKDIGEDLENWIDTNFSNSMGFLKDVSFKKTNDSIDGKKPDFKFTVLNDDGSEIVSVVIEAKSEALNSKSNTKNSDHYKKLDSDRRKNGGNYSLLISELEKDNDEFLFKNVGTIDNEFENMFVVRPQYFIAFLMLIYNIAQNQKEIHNLEINFKAKKELLTEFEKMRDSILDVEVKQIEDKIQTSIKLAGEIQSKAGKIILELEKSLGSRNISTLKNKLNDFKINKIANKAEDLSSD